MTEALDHGQLVAILSSLGYLSIFLLITLENLGLPLPGETVLVGAAIYAGQTHQLDIILIVFSAASGGALGGTVGFWLGRIFGPVLTEKYGRLIGLTPRRIILGEYLFKKWGGLIIFFGRFVALLRVLAAILAGLNYFDPLRFFIFNAAGALLWSIIFGCGGYFFGSAIHQIAGPIGWIILICVIIGGVFIYRYLKQNEGRLMREAEQASSTI
ncbi:MAG: DedA family protein [Alphaproteobacteria bacterium]|nr:DedA family protein [Alphaproteobacteria bacterium]